jgi:phage terminase Nu1 subunit (DNA packaging protein)
LNFNRGEISEVFGVSVVTIDVWVTEGMPCIKRGRAKPSEYDLKACVQWRRQRDTAKSDVAAGIDEADKLEFELAVSKGEFMPISIFTELLSSENARVKAKILGLPFKIAPLLKTYLADPKYLNKVVDFITDEIKIVLEESASDEDIDGIGDDGDSESEGSIKAAAKPDRKPVGRPKGVSKPRRLG